MPSLGQVPIPEEQYRADLELLDRYQKYSSEIIRLSLLGIAGLAFFLVEIVSSADAPAELKDPIAGVLIAVSAVLFLIATATALAHRYHSSDGLFYHFKSFRLANSVPPEADAAAKADKIRNKVFRNAGRFLTAAVSLFVLGGVLFVVGFSRLIYIWAF